MKTTRQTHLDAHTKGFSGEDPASILKFRKMVLMYYADHGRDLVYPP